MENSQEYIDYYFLEGLLLDEPPDKYSCPICLSPVQREAFLTQCCGKHFCHECISRLALSRRPCPMCKSLPVMIFPNKERQREINQLRVCCPVQLQGRADKDRAGKSTETETQNTSDCMAGGQAASHDSVICDWQGELGQVDDHLKMVHEDDKRWRACCPQPPPLPSSQQQSQGQRRVCYFHLNQGMQQMNIRTHAHVGGSGQVPLIHVHSGRNFASTSAPTSTSTAGSLDGSQDNDQDPHHTAQGSTSPHASALQETSPPTPPSQDAPSSSNCQCGAHRRGVTTSQATPTSQGSARVQTVPVQVSTSSQGVTVQSGNVVTIQVPILVHPPLPQGSSAGTTSIATPTATPTVHVQSQQQQQQAASGQGQDSQDASGQPEDEDNQQPPLPQSHRGQMFRPGRVVIRHGRGPHHLVFRGGPGGGHTHFPGPPPRHHHHGHGHYPPHHHHHPPPHHPPPYHPPPNGHPPPHHPPQHPPPHPHLPPDHRDLPPHRPHHSGGGYGHHHHHHHQHRRHH